MPGLLDHLCVFAFAIFWPVYGAIRYPAFKRELALHGAPVRRRMYLQVIVVEWLFVLAVIGIWIYFDRTLVELGMAARPTAGFMIVLALVLAAIVALARQHRRLLRGDANDLAQLRKQVEPVKEVLPQSAREMRLFTAVSITAGICEELLYRAYLIWYLDSYFPLWAAAAISILFFGIAHAYQGFAGMFKTGAVGLIATLAYLFAGSLLPPILLHVVIDIQGGLAARIALRGAVDRGDE